MILQSNHKCYIINIMIIEFSTIDAKKQHTLLTQVIQPRPIAWISTRSKDGIDNLSPFSFFTVASANPPVLSISHINSRNSGEKDTLMNLREQGECVVNIVNKHNAHQMNETSASMERSVSEFEAFHVESIPSTHIAPLSVASALVRIECRLREIIPITKDTQESSTQPLGGTIILLDIIAMFLDDTVYNGEVCDSQKLENVGKMGGAEYTYTDNIFKLKKPL